ncbi:MAG: hypothetical protein KBE91_01520 [Bacteroidia bacterium]|nr:hypothetical protein [Bacteroidia bacterium]
MENLKLSFNDWLLYLKRQRAIKIASLVMGMAMEQNNAFNKLLNVYYENKSISYKDKMKAKVAKAKLRIN